MKNDEIHQVMPLLREAVKQWRLPIVTQYSQRDESPYKILIGCVLSLRTKDETTEPAAKRLFKKAGNPKAMLKLSPKEIETEIYPVGFYKTKARQILKISEILMREYGGRVPDELDELLALPGVGRKTANLVVTLGFGKPGICVDTHVHRITNRWGYVKTKTPEETEFALRKKLPPEYWLEINDLLVTYGQNLCRPISPFCSRCGIAPFCGRRNVETSR
jgi:endonuclease-3